MCETEGCCPTINKYSNKIIQFAVIVLLFTEIKSINGFHLHSNSSLRHTRSTRCSKQEFECIDGTCISSYNVCDGTENCPDKSDEMFHVCMKNLCPKNTFRCAYGACIDGDKKCNGVSECRDNSDESLRECPNFVWLNDGVTTKCRNLEFQCRSGQCIDKSDLCDGKVDCRDGSDETVTYCNTPYFSCPKGAFRCEYGACVDSFSKCNFINDCADGSDENHWMCGRNASDPQRPPQRPTHPSPTQPPPVSIKHNCKSPQNKPGTTYVDFQTNVMRIVCANDYILAGDNEYAYCSLGSWYGVDCVRQCEIPITSYSEVYKCEYRGNPVLCRPTVPAGTKMQVSCALGYVNDQELKSITNKCLNDGTWETITPFSCREDCGRIIDPGRPQIAFGTVIDNAKVPWNVALYSTRDQGSNWNFTCGGTLISANAVLTAAHCVTSEEEGDLIPEKNFRVAVGKFSRSWGVNINATKILNVTKIYKPAAYHGKLSYFKNDIALMELSTTIVLSYVVLPICIPRNDYVLRNGQLGVVAGWGRNENNVGSEELLAASLPYLSRDDCLKKFDSPDKVSDEKFCADIKKGPNVTTVMQGDSGAGYIFKHDYDNLHYIHGIVSTKIDDIIPTFTNINEVNNKKFLVETHWRIQSHHRVKIN